MSLYRHVASKDDLLELMLDAACGWAPERPAGAGWRGELEAWARALLRVYLHHPWLAGVALPVLVFGPRRLSWLESALESLTETTLDLERAADVVLGLDGTVRSSAQMIIPLTENPNDEAPLSMEALIRALLPRLDPERYPRAAAVFAAGGPGRTPPSGSSTGAADGTGFDPLASFEFQLATYLDGVAALDERGAPGRRPG
jgi:AcrR family transcriptional regulator